MPSAKVFIIAEAGVNHNGSVKTAKKLIDIAAGAGADAVKFQTFKAGLLASRYAPKAEYQQRLASQNETQFEMLKRLELNMDAHKQLLQYCNRKGIVFLSSPFDLESIDLLNKLGIKIFKIPSGEITNTPYLRKIGRLNKMIIMSTGMADLDEIKTAMDTLTASGAKRENITILHCTTEYPAAFKDVNLKAMLTMKNVFKVRVGYSDHTAGIEASVAAAALGAEVIEKHFTLDKNMKGPDHRASLEPADFTAMVKAVRNVEQALGDGIKRPTRKEQENKRFVRKSIVAAADISKGGLISKEMVDIKRPGTGLQPKCLGKVIGRRARRSIKNGVLIRLKDLI